MPIDAIEGQDGAVIRDAEHRKALVPACPATAGRSPRHANSDSTAPTERFRPLAIDLAASRIFVNVQRRSHQAMAIAVMT